MAEGFRVPIGLRLNQAARTVGRAFEAALEEAGGTLPTWHSGREPGRPA